MIVDCFTFFDELEILEVRLNALAPFVDKFFLEESTVTFTGKMKRMYFDENKSKFKDFNIVHIVSRDGMNQDIGKYKEDAWKRECYQREFLLKRAAQDIEDDEILLLSDVDEIPDLSKYNGAEGVFLHKLYYYYFNCYTGHKSWRGTVAVKKKNAGDLNTLRRRRHRMPAVGRGWHFSYLGTPERIRYKIESFSHTVLNTDKIKNGIAQNKNNLTDLFGKEWSLRRIDTEKPFTVQTPDGPEWLLNHKDLFQDQWVNQ